MRKADRRAATKNEEWGHSEKEWLFYQLSYVDDACLDDSENGQMDLKEVFMHDDERWGRKNEQRRAVPGDVDVTWQEPGNDGDRMVSLCHLAWRKDAYRLTVTVSLG